MYKPSKKKIVILVALFIGIILFIFTINNLVSTWISKDDYSNYLKITTDNSVKLTRLYQDEISLWNNGNYSNKTMVKITETFLPKFTNQLKEFNNTVTPEKYNNVKKNFVESFENEIKSYELFKDYLITNNSTKNDLSKFYLSQALNFETIARNTFTQIYNINQ